MDDARSAEWDDRWGRRPGGQGLDRYDDVDYAGAARTRRLWPTTSAAAGNAEAMTAFVQMIAGVLPVPAFFAPEHVERIMSQAAAA